MNGTMEQSGSCPKCGAQLHIPAELEQFSCMYCGARLTPDELVTEAAPAPMEKCEAEAAFSDAAGKLAGCIRRFPGYNRMIVQSEFLSAFEKYEDGTKDVFEQLDRAVCAQEERRQALLDEAAKRMLDDLEEAWRADPKWKNKLNHNAIRDDDKIILAIFFVPALRRQELSVSEALCEAIQREWLTRYPRSPFYLGDYETLANGFQKKRLCFITTAVCEAAGLPDDCAELTAFRAFRDGYLSRCEDGAALIAEYYNKAPGIVACIDACTDRAETYAAIQRKWLGPCWRDIQEGELERCKARYTQMVRTLEEQFLS